MPAFVKDEGRWEKAKKAASKSTKKGTDSYWALSNYLYHRMGKSEEDQHIAEDMRKSIFISASSGLAKTTKSHSGTHLPKPKRQPDPFGKKSVFFKSETEEFSEIKHPTLVKLKDLLLKHRAKNK